jgi:hypothetical protein
MRLLLIDHGNCDPPAGRVHRCSRLLVGEGLETLACGPASVSTLEAPTPGLHGIHLKDIAAANRKLAKAVRDGRAEAFLEATPTIPTALLGLVRETARQAVAEAVDGFDPTAILVLHAGIFADLAVETGVPVVIHVGPTDLAAAGLDERVHDLVVAALGSAELVLGADEATFGTLKSQWIGEADASGNLAGPIDDHCAGWLAEAVRIACRRRGG